MKKTVALILSAALALGCLAPALGENMKHERVFVVAGPDGEIRSLTDSVRLENRDGLEEMADASLLTGIENVGGDEAFTREGDALVWQARGNDIIYQGTAEQAPAIVPVVTLTLDGEEISAAELKNRTGEAALTVRYESSRELTALAVTLLPLPAGVTDIHGENAAVLSEAGQRVLVGYAAPGLDAELKLPASFSVSFHADHADLSWMMTLASADPISLACREIDARVDRDLRGALDLAVSLLTALKEGKDLPLLPGLQHFKTNLALGQANDFHHTLAKLEADAQALADSAAQLADNAKTLNESAGAAQADADALQNQMSSLAADGEAMTAGADALLTGALQSADGLLAARGLAAPALTAENYAEALDALASAQPPETAAELTALKSRLDQTVSFVGSLKAYTESAAQAARQAEALNGRLAGVSHAAASLNDGASALKKDAAGLHKNEAAKVKATVFTTEKQLASLALPYAQKDAARILDLYEQTRSRAQNGGYDLRPEGMSAVTVYVIRTDLQ